MSVTAVKCLLNVGDRYATEILKDFLGSKVKDKIDQAVMLAGSFRVKEVVGDLVGLLNKTGLSGADIHDKIPIVRALGDIGDTQAIPALRELLSKKRFFFRSVFELLKEEIYKTLKNYPYESVKHLVQDGVTSRNEVIRTESLQLRKGP